MWTQLGWNWEWTCVSARCPLGQSDKHVSPPREIQISKAVKTGCPCSHSCSDHFLLHRSKVTVCGALPGQHAGLLRGEDVWVETEKKEELKKSKAHYDWAFVWSAGAQEVKMARLLSKTRGSFMSSCVFMEFNIKRTSSLRIVFSRSVFTLSHIHCLFLYLCNLIVCFIMHSISSMQRHITDGCVIALYNLQNHNYHFLKE